MVVCKPEWVWGFKMPYYMNNDKTYWLSQLVCGTHKLVGYYKNHIPTAMRHLPEVLITWMLINVVLFCCYHGNWNVVSAADVHLCQQFQLYYPAAICCRLKTKMKIWIMMTLKKTSNLKTAATATTKATTTTMTTFRYEYLCIQYSAGPWLVAPNIGLVASLNTQHTQ